MWVAHIYNPRTQVVELENWPEFEASLGLRMRTSFKTLTKKKTKSEETGVWEFL